MEISNVPDKEFNVMIVKGSLNLREEWMNTVRISTKNWKI